jgi:diguanylate cyclase (GGDEF)-like protein/PAS domain S-box-containing protein
MATQFREETLQDGRYGRSFPVLSAHSNSILTEMPDYGGYGVLVVNGGAEVIGCNATAENMFCFGAGGLIGRSVTALLPELGWGEGAQAGFSPPSRFCSVIARMDGADFPVEVSVSEVAVAEQRQFIVILCDITERLKTEEDIRKLSKVAGQTADAVLITNAEGVIEFVNPAFEKMTGFTKAEVIGQTPRIVKSGAHGAEFYADMWRTIRGGRVFRAVFVNRRKNGEIYYEEKAIAPVRDRFGKITHHVATARDVTERVCAEEHIEYLANYDSLTGLPNRDLFMDRLQCALVRGVTSGKTVALLRLDLDDFRAMNEMFGHAAGDALLKAVAFRLRNCVRRNDTVARLGDDEFAVVLGEVDGEGYLESTLAKVLSAFRQPFKVNNRFQLITASIGVSVYPADGANGQSLLRHADMAMYRAKEAGKNGYCFFEPDMREVAVDRGALETDLRGALEAGHLHLRYQPQFDADTGGICGVEALLRWEHPDKGLISPPRYIPQLDDMELVSRITEWTIRETCLRLRELQRAGSVPVSAMVRLANPQVMDPALPDRVAGILDETGVDPALLELAVAESLLIENIPATVTTLQRLADMGVCIAVTDFGSDHSCLPYPRRFPVHTIRTDCAFIWRVAEGEDASAIAAAVMALAEKLGVKAVVGGVERAEQFDLLRQAGCRVMQGPFFSQPLPLEALKMVLSHGDAIPWQLYAHHSQG